MSASATADRDPGLQPERTRLAWRRTTLSGTVSAVLAMKTALHGGPSSAALITGALCCTLWLCLLYVAHRRIHTLTSSDTPPTLTRRTATTTVLCTVAMAACGAALLF
ncbi:DUF202 domain-containing protein [Streptomyces sp. NPDC005303]|uniref:DUF202 domain-containing protein n=1 Tax=Streptomyces sp. NPDC005303 TaxID=3155713 RepID=UPI0033AA468B